MTKELITIKSVIKWSKPFYLTFLYFNILPILFYFIGNYQFFNRDTTNLVLRIMVLNNSFLFFFFPNKYDILFFDIKRGI